MYVGQHDCATVRVRAVSVRWSTRVVSADGQVRYNDVY